MCRKYKIPILFYATLLFTILLLFSTGCDSILPAEFKQKEFTASNKDTQAMELLSRAVTRDVRGQLILDSLTQTATARSLVSLVDSATRANNTDNQIISSRFSVLTDSLKPGINRDMVNLIVCPRNQQVVYAYLQKVSGQSSDFYLYTSMEFYRENVNEYIGVQILKNDTSEITSSVTVPVVDVASSLKKLKFTTGTVTEEIVVRVVKARYQFHIEDGSYIVRFTISDPTKLIDPSISNTAPAFFKVLILSR